MGTNQEGLLGATQLLMGFYVLPLSPNAPSVPEDHQGLPEKMQKMEAVSSGSGCFASFTWSMTGPSNVEGLLYRNNCVPKQAQIAPWVWVGGRGNKKFSCGRRNFTSLISGSGGTNV